MDQEAIIAQFEALGAVLHGHFVLASGRHSDTFVSKDMVSSDPNQLMGLVEEIASYHPEWSEVDLIAAPAVGAIAFGTLVASVYERRFVYAEPSDEIKDELEFKRGFASFIKPGTRILIVEDIITTAKTVKQMIAAVEKLGGVVKGILLLWLRGENEIGQKYPLFALVEKTFPTWPPLECPLCIEVIPITTRYNKHGREFLAAYGSDPANWPSNQR